MSPSPSHHSVDNARKIVSIIAAETVHYLGLESQILAKSQDIYVEDVKELNLLDLTAIVGVGGFVNMFVAISFEFRLLDKISESFFEGIDMTKFSQDEIRNDVAGETINIIIGKCTEQLKDTSDEPAHLTPPVLIDHGKKISAHKNAQFFIIKEKTSFGDALIACAGPKELFNPQLDYKKEMIVT